MKRDTKIKGDISELMAMAAFIDRGFTVAKPFGENARYDFLAEHAGGCQRVQVKTGRVRNGVVIFNCQSSHYHRHGGQARNYLDEADLFAVYCREANSVYTVPVDGVGTRGSLRLGAPKNGQRSGIRWAEDHAFAEIAVPDLVGLPGGSGVAEDATPS
jgi:hypothetical protein